MKYNMQTNTPHLPFVSNHRATETVSDEFHKSRFMFGLLCLFLAAQVYNVPVLPIGPIWALWPTFADIVMVMLFVSVLFYRHPLPSTNRRIFRLLIGVFIFLTINFLGLTVWSYMLELRFVEGNEGFRFAISGLYRVAQVIAIFYVVSIIPLNEKRHHIIERIIFVVISVSLFLIFLTYLQIVTTTQLSAHLSSDPNISGPWAGLYRLYDVTPDGLGAISYNHGIVASQIITLLGFLLFISNGRNILRNNIIVIICIAGNFVSGSRTGFIAITILGAILYLQTVRQRPVYSIFVALGGILILYLGLTQGLFEETLSNAVERQIVTVTNVEGGSANLSGRLDFWEDHINILNENLLHWFIGSGLGTTKDTGHHSHNNYLTVVFEMGLIGLVGYFLFLANILKAIWQHDIKQKPFFLLTLILLFTSLTLEVFYPAAQRSAWLPLYFTMLAIVIQRNNVKESNQEVSIE